MTEISPRLDKWLWHARFFKSRSLASALCQSGKLRIAGSAVTKAHHRVKMGDVLTFPQGRHIRVVRVLALATRRGPAREARQLYEDLSPPTAENRLPGGRTAPAARRPAGAGRPTKRERRQTDALRGGDS
jgi:ribosome-associated heat shock protein Hsp15